MPTPTAVGTAVADTGMSTPAAAGASASGSRSITPTKRMNAVIQSQSDATQQDPYHHRHASPHRTPPRRRKDPPSSYPRSARLAAATGATTFFDDTHGFERDSATDDDTEDHHDLTYTSKHIPRASLVDNMVMALDQFSIITTEPKYFNEESRGYRGRGHTFSSSISSEGEIRSLANKQMQPQSQKVARRSSARYTRDPSKLPSIFGEDEDTLRSRIYESQRAELSMPPKRHRSDDAKAKSGGSTSSLDLSHLKILQGKLGPAGNRRSQSFDFGSKRLEDGHDQHDMAPHPIIYAGPKAQKNPTSPSLPSAPLARRDSNKSSKIARNKGSAPGTNTMQTGVPNISTSTPAGRKSPLDAEPASASRSGLFRRFFGSSKNPPPTPTSASQNANQAFQDPAKDRSATPPATHRSQRPNARDSPDMHNKENVPPVITKKPSSFFRRRKKSVDTKIAPPLPLTLNSSINTDVQSGSKSPVSSLKAFMDPYLTDEQAQKRAQSPTSPLRTFYTAQDSAATGFSRVESPDQLKSPTADLGKLVVPQKETFLTDNSSAEDIDDGIASDFNGKSKKPSTKSSRNDTRVASSTSTLSTIRPVVEARSSSWQSGGLTDRPGIPPRSDSLTVMDSRRVMTPTSPNLPPLTTQHRNTSGSDVSEYRSAPSTPAVQIGNPVSNLSPRLHVSHPSVSQGPTLPELDKAQEIYNNGEDDIEGTSTAAWLGESGSERERIRKAYMQLFDWTGHTILASLRSLCSRLVLKAESQLIDRILYAFAQRWCDCNHNHGFKSTDVVHTICYSLLLLNTDLHMADIGSKMTRTQFVRNAMQTIRPVAADSADNGHGNLLTVRTGSSGPDRTSTERDASRTGSALSSRPSDLLVRTDSSEIRNDGTHPILVDAPFSGSQAGWEVQIEAVLKDFYLSIQREHLPLFGSDNAPRHPPGSSNNNLLSLSGLRRTPSVLSKAQSEGQRSRYGDSKSLGAKWNKQGRARGRLGSTPGFGSSKNSLEDGSSAWSPSMSSTWSKASLGKTLTSMSVDSFATSNGIGNDYQSSIGFANALSQAIIREDQLETQTDDGMKAVSLLEDETLELEGAPWAKEGIVKHKCHLEGVDKRSKDRNWNDCFAVIEKGWMRLFSFSVTAKSLRTKARNQKAGGVVGGGNWQDNAEEVWKFMLRHTIASSLPPPGYSKQRPHVWALSLPTGAVHLFSVGTPDIVKEFVSTANFWSARLSKEPMIGGVSSMEYGWSDAVINRALTGPDVRPSFTSSDYPRPSTQMSVRSSIDHGGSMRPKLPGDKIFINDWTPPQQSLLASQLMEVDQLKALQTYVSNVEEDLQKHNELRGPMMLAFSSKHSNHAKAMGNWEKKSSYLLREIVKFKNYIDALQGAQITKDRIYKLRREEEKQRQADDDSMAIYQSSSMDSGL